MKYCLWRVQAVIQTEHLVSRHWAEHLGFKEEGTMQAFGPAAENFVRYAKLYPEQLPKKEAMECHLS